jgi:Raf kinase inhibitor-like YbhB/YbcL family protein
MYLRSLLLTILLVMVAFPLYASHPTTGGFSLHTNAFTQTNPIPAKYTCDGQNISPELDWENVPPPTQSLALVMTDPDAPGGTFYHWLLYNIPITVTTLPQGSAHLTAEIKVGKNNWDKQAYNGPCPPLNSTHHYIFTLYALNTKLSLPDASDAKTLKAALQNHILESVELTTTYSRQ